MVAGAMLITIAKVLAAGIIGACGIHLIGGDIHSWVGFAGLVLIQVSGAMFGDLAKC